MSSSSSSSSSSPSPSSSSSEEPPKLVDIPVTTQNGALQLFVSFLTLAQKRGAYTLQESAKIWECIQVFQKSADDE